MSDDPVANTVVPPDTLHKANIMPIQTRREFNQLREPRVLRLEEPRGKITQAAGIEGGILLQVMETRIYCLCQIC